jgi:sugar lactone lactonase YvrE
MRASIFVLIAVIAFGVACQKTVDQSGGAAAEAEATTMVSDVMKALDAKLEFPSGLAIDAQGRIYVAEREGFRVRRIDLGTGEIATIAGLGIPGHNGDGIPAKDAMLGAPESLAIDSEGDLYIGERGTFRVRRIDMETGLISTYAGSGERGFEGDGGLATDARISNPFGLAFDDADNLFIADTENHKVRMVDRKSGRITTIAGTGEKGFDDGSGVAFDAKLNRPHVCVIGPDGVLLIGDSFNQRLRRVDPSGAIETSGGTGEIGGPAVGKKATESPFIFFGALVYDGEGNLLVTSLDNRIVRIDGATGVISHVAGNGKEEFSGDGGPAVEAGLQLPYGMVVDDGGNIVFADGKNNRVRRIMKVTGVIETIAGGGEIQGFVVKPPVEEE